jgi:hypothetical protein
MVTTQGWCEFPGILELLNLEGWNHIPKDFGARFDLNAAPWWLCAWFATPLLDRFAYPVLVRRGYGHLSPQPGIVPDPGAIAGATRAGWIIDQS